MLVLLLACAETPKAGADPRAGDSAADTGGDTAHTDAGGLTVTNIACDAPAAGVAYTDVAAAWGLVETASADARRKEHPPVAFADLDGDGDDDVLLAHPESGIWLHVNAGGAFSATVVDAAPELTSLALADLDGDRDLDLFAGGKGGRVRLYANDGGAFTDVTAGWAVPALGADVRDGSFGDYDGDGDPDLYIVTANDGRTEVADRLHRLLRNDGGAFTDVSDLVAAEARSGLGWQATWHDFDRDGDLDLFVANAEQSSAGPSRYLRNDGAAGAGWTFTDLTETCACGYTGSNMGASPADLDGDGWTDLFVTNTGPAVHLRNDAAGAWIDVTVVTGAGAVPDQNWMTFGSAAADHDNDGDLDVFASTGPLHGGNAGPQVEDQPDVLLAYDAGRYTDIAPALGLADPGAGRGVAFGNLDGDGFPDLLLGNLGTSSRLWKADCTDARALVVELDGPAPNRFGVGARVELHTDAGVQVRVIDTKPGWAAAGHPRAWFGLGEADGGTIVVTWPDGVMQRWEVAGDTKVTVVRAE